MKAILIDSKNKEVREVDYSGDYNEIYTLCGFSCFTCVDLDDKNTMFVDDEGLINGTEDFFLLDTYGEPLAGNALILGMDVETGASVATTMDTDEVRGETNFANINELRLKYSSAR